MKKFLTRLLVIVGLVTTLSVAASIALGVVSYASARRVPEKTIVEINLERPMVEYVAEDPVAKVVFDGVPRVRDVVEALEKAAKDDRVVALVARVGAVPTGLARIQELRDAVTMFRASGKKAVAYAETLGEFGPGNGAYYLATAFDKVYLQPTGSVGLTGLIYEQPFVSGTLEKLGIEPRLDSRLEYKSAKNMFTERAFTPPHKEALEKVMESQFTQIVRGIAAARGLTEKEVRALVDRGPFLATEALEAKLVDGLLYRDEVYAAARKEAGHGAEFLYLLKYLGRVGRPHVKGDTIALIHGAGAIIRGKSKFDPLFGGAVMGPDSVAAAFRAAVKDKNVKAILFRVDSPGGSAVASDTIWRESVRAKEAGKPVIVSMGNVAGSGGYYVAMSANKIVAQPGTITGSIGVLAGKMLTSGFWEKLGVSWDELHTSPNATMWTGMRDYTPEQWERFQAFLDDFYDGFTDKVAQGRGLPKEKVLEIAKGRIWTGEDAKALGLVDELGGLSTALRLAKEAAGIPKGVEVRLKTFPREKPLIDMCLEMLVGEGPDSSEESASTAVAARSLESLEPLFRTVEQLGLNPNRGVLSMPCIAPMW
ncbi:MAG TPA: signal peptide peptidase SppA [Candidatus Hydrogenedentes bacterium]|nr:signal peptide peptidase SppA [Candidatus Hydrogenedentota bacterium]